MASSVSPNPSFVPRTWHAAAGYAAFTALFFSKILFGSAFLWEDFVEQEIPYRVFASQCLAHGSFPFWNPYTFCGMPFFAQLQTAVLYPTNLLLTVLIAPGSLGTWWIEFFIIAHYWIAAFGMYLLCRREFSMSGWGAFFAGVAFGFSGIMVTHAIHQGMIFQFAWLPWVVLCMLAGVRRSETRWFLLGGAILGVSMLAGHPQITLYTVTGLGILTAALLITEWKERHSAGRAAALAGRAALLVAIAAGVFAVQYIPSVELAGRVVRSDVTYEFASEGSLQWSQAITAFVPKFFGSSEAVQSKFPFWLNEGKQYFIFWETCFYAGIATMLLAFIGAWRGRKMPLRGGLVALLAFAVLYALGDNFVLFPALFQLPLFNKFRDPARVMYLFTFAAAILAGRGMDLLIERKAQVMTASKHRVYLWLAAGVVGGLLLMVTGGALFDVPQQFASAVNGQIGLFIALWVAGVLLVWRMEIGAGVPVIGGTVLILAIDLALFGSGINNGTRDPKLVYNQYPEIRAKLRAAAATDLFRIRMREGGYMLMQRNQGPVDRLCLIEGYSPLVLQRHIPIMASPSEQNDMMNVRYEVAVDSARRGLSMRERSSPAPRAFVVHRAMVMGDSAVQKAITAPFDFRNVVYLEKSPAVQLTDGAGLDSSRVRITAYEPNMLRIETASASDGVLVTSEIDYPGWTATIDGRATEVLRANSCLRAVALPNGTHVVEFTFSPTGMSAGAWISGVALCVGVLGFAALSIRRPARAA